MLFIKSQNRVLRILEVVFELRLLEGNLDLLVGETHDNSVDDVVESHREQHKWKHHVNPVFSVFFRKVPF